MIMVNDMIIVMRFPDRNLNLGLRVTLLRLTLMKTTVLHGASSRVAQSVCHDAVTISTS
jgi:hypothetical protein